MFEFLKKLFGIQPKETEQDSGKQAAPEPQKPPETVSRPASSPVQTPSASRPGVVQEINRFQTQPYTPPKQEPAPQRPTVTPSSASRPGVIREINRTQPQSGSAYQRVWTAEPQKSDPVKKPVVPAKSVSLADRTWGAQEAAPPARTTAWGPAKTTTTPMKPASPVVRTREVPKVTPPARTTAGVPAKTTVPAQSPVAQPKTAVPRKVVAPRSQGRVQVPPEKRIQKTSVYIGLDFGTTFTKAAYEIAPSNVHTKYSIQFGKGNTKEDYYLPSVLYYDPDNQRLKISDDTGDCEEIRYFKYNMISDALQKNKILNDPAVVTQTPKEQLCSVFFLSYVISLIQDAVYLNFDKTRDPENTSWYINMGVPLEAHMNDKRAAVYKKVLEMAFLFEQKHHGLKEIDIKALDMFFQEHMPESNPNINILPEIYAEVLLYQQYLNTPAGFYTVVDIGGGTEDIATFLKMTDRFGETVDCLAQNVISYGFDAIAEKIVKSVGPGSVTKAKALLKRTINFNDNETLRTSVPKEVDFDSLIDARRECRTLFGTCVQRARKTNAEIMEQTVNARLPMHIFVMGGARSVEFYRSSIAYMMEVQKNAGIPFFKDADVFDYVGRNTRLEIRNDQRLVISQMLAQPFEMIPEINHMPWELKEKNLSSKAKSWDELQEVQNELYPV